MLLTINHTSVYRYEHPAPYVLQRLRLTPQSGRTQTVHDWKVSCVHALPEASYRDGFGNIAELIRHERNATEIMITAKGSVSTHDNTGVVGEDNSATPLWVFARLTPLTAPGEAIAGLTRQMSPDLPRLELLHALMGNLVSRMAYEKDRTDSQTTAEEAFAAGRGVCQDLAHVYISAARSLDIPARYVSGYLLTEGDGAQAASHAWAEAHVPGLGWVGFDPANNMCPDERYVRVATGLDYRDAAPISGIRLGSGGESLEVAVKVEQ